MPAVLDTAPPSRTGPPSCEPLRLRSLALPAEHGGWGMLGEPLLLGLLIAPSGTGVAVALAATFAFLARHPLKLAVADWRSGRRTRRTEAAEGMALLYGGLAAAGLAAAARSASAWWIPFLIAAPVAAIQFLHDVRHQGRQLVPEILGGIALGSVVAAIVLAAGWDLPTAAALWALVATKAIGAIVYVRARLRCDRRLEFSRKGALSVHAFGFALALALATTHGGPWLTVAGFGLLLSRAAHGLSRFHRPVRPQVLGIMEMAWGLAFVVLCAAGYRFGL